MIDYFLADDLSGALDAAAAFHEAGRRVRIVLSAEQWEIRPDDDVIGVTTESRNAHAPTAAALVTGAIGHAQKAGARLVYKKVDSTLRGPVAAELAALAAAMPSATLLFAPANPAVGRTVNQGLLRVHGVPVTETDFARDPAYPVRDSRVASYAPPSMAERIVIPDTATTADLDLAVETVRRSTSEWIAIGSGALARPVARALPPARPTARERAVIRVGGPVGVLLVGGSAHPLNRIQAQALAQSSSAAVRELSFAAPEEAVRVVVSDLAHGGTGILVGEAIRCDSRHALTTLAAATHEIILRSNVRRVFVTGGETAFAIATRLGVTSLEFTGSVEPGLALAAAFSSDGGRMLAVKPGGFGDDATWRRAWAALRSFE